MEYLYHIQFAGEKPGFECYVHKIIKVITVKLQQRQHWENRLKVKMIDQQKQAFKEIVHKYQQRHIPI